MPLAPHVLSPANVLKALKMKAINVDSDTSVSMLAVL